MVKKYWNYFENIVFLIVAIFIIYGLITGFAKSTWQSFFGNGFVQELLDPVNKNEYYKSVLALLSISTTFFILLEISKLIFISHKAEKTMEPKKGLLNITLEVFRCYKSNFLAKVFNEYLSKIIVIFVYIIWMPYFQKYALFQIGNTWYWWLYAYLVWELTYWLWHFLAHRVRLFWCLHSPHHAPSEMNLTVAWVHFFAEGYFTAIIQVPLLMLLGVSPAMVAIILVIDGTWGTFIHAGERSFTNGRFGFLQHIFITPSHHRVHHAKNPLYIDTNFCVLLPFWDWLFGTLQTEKKEVVIEYGITRDLDVTNFLDFYFGEFVLLSRDIRHSKSVVEAFQYIFRPPGWAPNNIEKTATVVRRGFINQNPSLATTSRDILISKIKSFSN